jgi:hypothetical protein
VNGINNERLGHEAYGDESGEKSRITWEMTMKQQYDQFQVWESISDFCLLCEIVLNRVRPLTPGSVQHAGCMSGFTNGEVVG